MAVNKRWLSRKAGDSVNNQISLLMKDACYLNGLLRKLQGGATPLPVFKK